MNQPKLWKTLAIAGFAGVLGTVGIQSNAQAAFLADYTGYSVFAAPDPFTNTNVEPNPLADPAPPNGQCAFCDSTVSFAVWENESGSLTQDLINLGIDPAAIFGTQSFNPLDGFTSELIDDTAQYLYLYQVVNTDPLPQAEDDLTEYRLAVKEIDVPWQQMGKPPEEYLRPWLGANPYTSGGYIDDYLFDNASLDTIDNILGVVTDPAGGTRLEQECLNDLVPPPGGILGGTGQGSDGCPGNWTPDVLVDVTPIVQGVGADAIALSYDLITDDEVERQQRALYGSPITTPTNGVRWQFLDGTLPSEATSDLLFLTSNEAPDFPWAQTQSPGGEGTSGDVPGAPVRITDPEKVPEPGTVLGLLAISGLSVAAKRKKQK